MSRKSQTVATFAVRIVIPKDRTIEHVRNTILNGTSGYDGGHLYQPDEIKVTLLKKETTYGP